MSGHSKWSTIKRKKALVDAKRSKSWTKVIKEITVAARMGGGDASGNPRLRMALDKAKAANLPKDNINRAIDKGTGGGDGGNFEDVVYEGYAAGGVAVVVECTTDNRNRTVGEVRHMFDRFGGNMGASGSVAWMFKTRGIINVLKDSATEEQLMEVALEVGAEDVRDDDEVWTIDCEPSAYLAAKEALEAAQIAVEYADVENIAENRTAVTEDKAERVLKLMQALEDLDDVHNVYANYDIPDDVLERLEA